MTAPNLAGEPYVDPVLQEASRLIVSGFEAHITTEAPDPGCISNTDNLDFTAEDYRARAEDVWQMNQSAPAAAARSIVRSNILTFVADTNHLPHLADALLTLPLTNWSLSRQRAIISIMHLLSRDVPGFAWEDVLQMLEYD